MQKVIEKKSYSLRHFATLLLFVCIATISNAKGKEPRNNLGKTISELRQVFPNASYVRTETKGDFYTDGEDPSEGLSCFFYLKNNRVIEECMIIQSNDGFPKMVYDQWINTFSKYMSVAAFGDGVNHMCFSTFSMHIMFFAEYGKNTALLVYQAGGVNNGITYNDFMKKWSK